MVWQKLIKLDNNQIHLWYVRPAECNSQELLESYQRLLTKEETVRQQRYIFAEDRHDALVTRAFVRELVSFYVEEKPEKLSFQVGDNGKPELLNCSLPLKFNISHTKDLIICAVTLNDEIGCDVEQTNRDNDVLSIAERFFSKDETTALFSLVETEQIPRFFDYWTLKESYIKAWGLGLAIPLGDFSFYIDTCEHHQSYQNHNIRLSFSENRQDNPDHWQSWLCYPSPDYRIAVSIWNPTIKLSQSEPFEISVFKSMPLEGYEKMSVEEFCLQNYRCDKTESKTR